MDADERGVSQLILQTTQNHTETKGPEWKQFRADWVPGSGLSPGLWCWALPTKNPLEVSRSHREHDQSLRYSNGLGGRVISILETTV